MGAFVPDLIVKFFAGGALGPAYQHQPALGDTKPRLVVRPLGLVGHFLGVSGQFPIFVVPVHDRIMPGGRHSSQVSNQATVRFKSGH